MIFFFFWKQIAFAMSSSWHTAPCLCSWTCAFHFAACQQNVTLAAQHTSQDSKIAKVALKFLKKLLEPSSMLCHVDQHGNNPFTGGLLVNDSKCSFIVSLFAYNALVILIYYFLNFMSFLLLELPNLSKIFCFVLFSNDPICWQAFW